MRLGTTKWAIAIASLWLAPSFLAAKEPAVDAPALFKGRVAFKPIGDQAKVPERYRLEPHEFEYEMRLKHDFEALAIDVFEVRFPSPVQTQYAVNNTVYAEYYVPKK